MSIRILVVDDIALTRLNLKTVVESAKPEMVWQGEAENGLEALTFCQAALPDIVLMDIGMPIMDGIQATRQLLECFPTVKVIMLTSHDADTEVLDAFRAGATSYCMKDTEPEVLLKAIRSTFEGEAWIDPKIARAILGAAITGSASTQVLSGQGPSGESHAGKPSEIITDTGQVLSERELEVLALISEGKSNQQIAEELTISLNTVKTHLKNIFQKMGVEDRTTAALKAVKEKWIG
jgi:DNA-binding NarL/FixJ family response regulator